ncbi:MAG: hypothetical protein WDA71_06960 [Actinomycetota bacterium]
MSSAFRTLLGFMLAAVVASGGGAALAKSGPSGALPDQSNGRGHALLTEELDLDTDAPEAEDTDGPRVWIPVPAPTNHGEAVSAAAHCQDVGEMKAPAGCMDDPKVRADYVRGVAQSDLGKPDHETTGDETTGDGEDNGKGPKDPKEPKDNPGHGHGPGGDGE